MAKKKVSVIKNPDDPEPTEVIADAIIKISAAFDKLKDTPLKDRTILLLLRDMTRLPFKDIQAVLDAVPLLKETYIKGEDDE